MGTHTTMSAKTLATRFAVNKAGHNLASPRHIQPTRRHAPACPAIRRSSLKTVVQFLIAMTCIGQHANAQDLFGITPTRPAPAILTATASPAVNTLDITPTDPSKQRDRSASDLGITPLIDTWEITPGASLKTTLVLWCKKGGCASLAWEIPGNKDYVFDQPATFSGSFGKAVYDLAENMKSILPFKPVYFTGNRILRITVPTGAN